MNNIRMNNNGEKYALMASRQSRKILRGTLAAVEVVQSESKENIECAVVFYGDYKVFIRLSELNISREDRKVARSMLGANVEFVIKELDLPNKMAVGSRKEAMQIRKNIELRKYKEGDRIMANITSIGKDHCNAECLGLECHVPINEIDYGYIDEIDKHVQIGDRVPAIIKRLDVDNDLIEVSIKDAKEDPYEKFIDSFEENGEYLGTVTGIQGYGVFLSLRKGIHCLCPFPNWANFYPSVGDKIVVRIKSINKKERKINATFVRVVNQNR